MLDIKIKRTFSWITSCCLVLCAIFSCSLQASEVPTSEEAIKFVKDVVEEAMKIANDSKGRSEEFGQLFERKFEKGTAERVLGRNKKLFNKEQKSQFHESYKKLLISSFADPERVKNFKNTTYKIDGRASLQSDGSILVKIKFFFKDKPRAEPVEIATKIVKKDGEILILDVYIEGISQLMSQIKDYDSIFRDHNKGKNDPEKFLDFLEREANIRR